MTEFTKGPWSIHKKLDFIVSSSDEEIADTSCSPNPQADANLIAAAPDLYEALVDVMAEISFLGNEVHYFGTTERFDAARAALAKARGEA